jgi:hypothetical protein
MTTIHELQQILWVTTSHGDGIVLFIMDYGMQNNTVWVVALEDDGAIKHYDSNQIKLCYNNTINFNTKKQV